MLRRWESVTIFAGVTSFSIITWFVIIENNWWFAMGSLWCCRWNKKLFDNPTPPGNVSHTFNYSVTIYALSVSAAKKTIHWQSSALCLVAKCLLQVSFCPRGFNQMKIRKKVFHYDPPLNEGGFRLHQRYITDDYITDLPVKVVCRIISYYWPLHGLWWWLGSLASRSDFMREWNPQIRLISSQNTV